MNRISVIIPTYQHASTIAQALDSLLRQTRKADEILVVDDGSTDETKEVLKPYNKAITYIYQENQGAPVARNVGFEQSSGDLVIFWDADVVGNPEMLAELEAALDQHPECAWAYGSFFWGKRLFQSQPFDSQALRTQNYIHTTALIRRKDFPGFDPSLKRFQDWDLWLTMSEQGKKGIFVNQPLYRVLVDSHRPTLSSWMPEFFYKIPWQKIGWVPARMREYTRSREVILEKHHL